MGKVAWDYIKPVKQPADVKGFQPGKLPDSILRPVKGGGKMHWIAACAWEAMVEKAKSEGLELKPTSAGDTYRSYDSQLAGFRQRYQLQPIPGASTRTFEGKKWYLKKGFAPLAAPGTSQHNTGLAVDVHTAGEPKRLNWLIANVKDFGFSWEVVPQEPWHLRYCDGDNPPPAVKAYMEKNGVTAPVAGATSSASVPAAGSSAPSVNDDGGDLEKGDSGPRVTKLQEELAERGFYKGKADGDFGPKTAAAVIAYKASKGYGAGSKAGKRVLDDLGIGL
jgi:hypothetical protein